MILASFAGRVPALPAACTIAMPRRIVQFMPLLNRQRDPLIFESSSSSASTPLITRDKHSPLKHKITWKDTALEAEQAHLQLQSIDGRITFARARPSDAQSNSTDLIRSLSESNRHSPPRLLKRNRSRNKRLLSCSCSLSFFVRHGGTYLSSKLYPSKTSL